MVKAVLIADDNPEHVVRIRTTLRDAGSVLPMTFVSNAAAVIAYLMGTGQFSRRERFPLPNILLLDLKMPQLDGFKVLEWIRKQKQFDDLLIVILTDRELSYLHEAFRLGARVFLTKPCRVHEVQNLMRTHSTHWEAESEEDTLETQPNFWKCRTDPWWKKQSHCRRL